MPGVSGRNEKCDKKNTDFRLTHILTAVWCMRVWAHNVSVGISQREDTKESQNKQH